MEAKNSKTVTNEMIFEELKFIRSQMEKLQSDFEKFKNPVGEFTSKWVDTYDVMQMLRVSRRTMDNYIKAGKLTPTRIRKRNYFAIDDVKRLMHVPEVPKLKSFQEDINWMIKENKMPIKHSEYNPYTEAFWKWWPELYNELHTFRITGGEPLLSKDTFKVLDYIIEHPFPNKKLKLAINSNLGVPTALVQKLIEKIKKIEDENRVKEIVIFTSCDTWGEHAEYIRTGLEFNKFWDHVNMILTACPRVIITFMSTYNALSVFNYENLIHNIYTLKDTYASNDRYWSSAVFLDSSYLRYPLHQTVQVLPFDYSKYILDQAKLITYYAAPSFSPEHIGYSDVEVQKVKRIYDWMLAPQDSTQQMKNRYNFYQYFSNHDLRRGTDFCKTFPELEEFYNFCKTIKV